MFKLWDLNGVIWDEPKLVDIQDFSPKAVEKLGINAPLEKHVQAFADFLTEINRHIKTYHPEKRTCLFTCAKAKDWQIDVLSKIQFLDDFGCDGRPWYLNDKENPED
jgi:hypothetical protein